MEKKRFRVITVIADIIFLTISFLIMVWFKPASLKQYLPSHFPFFAVLAVVWLIVSLLNGKMHKGKIVNLTTLFNRVITSNIISLSITALLMYSLRRYDYSRLIVLGTTLLATFFELLAGVVFLAFKKAIVQDEDGFDKFKILKKPSENELVRELKKNNVSEEVKNEAKPSVVSKIEKECGPDMAKAVAGVAGGRLNGKSAVLSTTSIFNIHSLPLDKYTYIINLHKINDIKELDSFLEAVNSKLESNGYFFCCVETKDQRKARLFKKFPPVINYIYYFFDFIVKRVFPKLQVTRGLYFFLTHGSNAVISRAEALGRLCRAGFKIRQESFIGNQLCIEAMKSANPLVYNEYGYGAIIALPRVGKGGRSFKVYKLRTMHPYSEYLQDYVYSLYNLQEGGKFKNDFRITTWGAVCRKIWIDELPMLINFFKGDMKIVGVRPLSKQYFELYSKELQEMRIKHKPGLVPPFYADMPTNLEEIQISEMNYLQAHEKHPVITDIKYFSKSMRNILFRNARSN
jgi:lipopolysaccharide/colanic/teichoic acid biosynthesis glycosyltransferase